MKLRNMSLFLLAIASTYQLLADDILNHNFNSNNTNGKPFFVQRSQGDNLARRIVGEEFLLVQNGGPCWLQGVGSVAVEYTRSFDRPDLGTYFSFNKTPSMLFAGDNAPAEVVAARDVRAEYFGLASDFVGFSEFKPQVENGIVDFNFRFFLDRMLCGLFFDVGIPFNWTRFGMDLVDDRIDAGTVLDIGLGVNNPPPFSHSITQAYKGINGGIPIAGIVVENMHFGRICGKQTKSGVADLELGLGYFIWSHECSHLSVSLRGKVPTGTRPNGEFVFEPIVGSGRHPQIGAGLSWHTILWQDDCCAQSFSFWFDAQVYHLANARQKRTFDLRNNGVGSRYLQLKKFNPDNSFTGLVIPAVNITTLDADVRIGAAGEALIMFDYQRCGFLFDFGYNVWGRSKENIKLRGMVPERVGVAGSIEAATDDRTKSNATIKTDGTVDGASPADNVYLTLADIDVASAAAHSAVSHKIFAHVSYMWDCPCYAPFVGIGGEAEFSGNNNNALSQWGAWIKGGVAFNML